MADRIRRMLALFRDGLVNALAIAVVYTLLTLSRDVFGFWPATSGAVAIIATLLWLAAGEEDHG